MKVNLFLFILLPNAILLINIEKIKETLISEEKNVYEIESNYIITQISWTKSENYVLNYVLGVFEASDDLSFADATPIAIIKEQGEFNEVNYLDLNTPKAYKYIRYIPPNKNNTRISPIKFYGYQIDSSDTLNQAKYFQVTNLPLISIHLKDESQSVKDADSECSIKIINNGKIEIDEKGFIKLRGRTSKIVAEKKSFRIKFESKQKIFNFKGKEKKWTLIANHFDRSFLRNALAFKISELMELNFTPRCEPVDVILNGIYQGNYYICDKIEVGKNRVNITKMEATDISEPNITGGYLLQIGASFGYGRNQPNIFKTNRGIPGNIEFPEEDELTSEQKDYISEKLNQFEEEIYRGVLDSIDLESYSKYFLVEEFCGDPDNVYGSFYFTKERNDNKFHFGPVWDFDLAFDNDERFYPTSEKPQFCLYYGDSAGTTRDFVKTLISNKNVIEYIKNTWDKLIESVLQEKILLNFIEERSQYIKESAELNLLKWDNYVGDDRPKWVINFGRSGEDFIESVRIVKEYVSNRLISLTELINEAYISSLNK